MWAPVIILYVLVGVSVPYSRQHLSHSFVLLAGGGDMRRRMFRTLSTQLRSHATHASDQHDHHGPVTLAQRGKVSTRFFVLVHVGDDLFFLFCFRVGMFLLLAVPIGRRAGMHYMMRTLLFFTSIDVFRLPTAMFVVIPSWYLAFGACGLVLCVLCFFVCGTWFSCQNETQCL